ncbi:RNA-directed DNA polymerase, eukaryota, reverse transcriptase zinc-binding domain protein [Tanacetum coccineum]
MGYPYALSKITLLLLPSLTPFHNRDLPWRVLLNKPDLLWVRIIKAVHGMEAGLDEKGTLQRFVGSGSRICFWKDIWLGDMPLCARFNMLYCLESEEICMLNERLISDTLSWNWRRPITYGRTSDLLHILMHELRHVALSANSDSWTWSVGVDGVFSVAATRLPIDHSILPSSTIETRWNKGLPKKVNIFIWRLHLDRLPTRLNLSKRGLEIDSILSPIRNANVESNDHIFFNCEVSSSVWDLIRLWCNISCPLPSSSHDWIAWIDNWPEIHGQDGGIGDGRARKSSHSPWYSIIQSVSKLQAKGIDLLGMCSRSVGNGNSTSFWGDSWCGGRPLKDKFPRVYALERNKLCSVAQRHNIEVWPSVLKRPPRGGAESNQFDEMIQSIQNVILTDSADGWKWELSSSGFSVASMGHYIDEQTLPGSLTSTRWVRCIPIKVNIFIWKLLLDKLPTLVNMDKKGIHVASLLCRVCNEHVENIDHLFFSYGMAKDLWDLLARWCALDLPEASTIEDWFTWLDAAQMSKRAKTIIEGVASTMMWSIWNFRNAWIFSMSKPKKVNI